MLKFVVDSLEGIPEALHPYYEKGQDGKFTLKVDGAKTQADIDRQLAANQQERTKHKETKDKLAAAETKLQAWGDLDVEDVQTRLEEHETLRAAVNTPETDAAKREQIVNERVEQKLKVINKRHEAKVQELTEKFNTASTELATVNGRVTTRQIKDEIRATATGLKVVPEMLDDIVELTVGKFTLQDGKAVTEEGIDVATYITDRKKDRPFWWTLSRGAGARPGDLPDGGKNPFTRENWNMTEQSTLVRADRGAAERLAAAAGTKIGAGMPPVKQAAS